jgi:hypothetical protein
VVSRRPAWREIRLLVSRELDEPVSGSCERTAYGDSLGDEECAAESAILDRLQVTGST